jgi:hypothetical protein
MGQEQQPYVVAVAEPCFQVLLTLQFPLMSCVIKPGQHGDELLLEQDQQPLHVMAVDQDRCGLKRDAEVTALPLVGA